MIRDKCNILLRFFHDYDFDCVSSKFLKFKKKNYNIVINVYYGRLNFHSTIQSFYDF